MHGFLRLSSCECPSEKPRKLATEDTTLEEAVVLVGGYGHVGREVARHMAPRFPGKVVLAGRNPRKARETALAIGDGCRGIELDVAEGTAPDGASTVIMCLDSLDPSFASDCLGNGIDYLDISADGRILGMAEGLHMTAKRNGARGLIDVGLAPGLTNVLAKLVTESAESPVESLDLFVLLGAGDSHGPAAIEWTLAHFDSEFEIVEAGRPRRVKAQREHRRAELPGDRKPAYGVRFDFPEQRSLARTLGIPTVSSWLATLPASAARSMRLAALAGGGELTRRPRSRAGLLRLLSRGWVGSDECGVLVQATLADGGTIEASLISRDQSRLTGILTGLFAAEVIEARVEPGVHHSDQAIDPLGLLEELGRADPGAELRLPGGANL